jgi:excisionase family DNA binding protein
MDGLINIDPQRLARPKPLAYNVNETAHLLGICRTTVYELVKQQKLKKVTIGGRSVITTESIDRLLADAIAEAA